MPDTDAVLVRRARGGDRDAFADLVRRHRPLLLRSCARMVGEDAAADAAQDAVLTAMLSLDRLREPASFGAWLVGIGLNACRALLRRRSGSDPYSRVEGPADARGSDPDVRRVEGPADARGSDPHVAAEVREFAARVHSAIAALPKGQREAVTLYYLAGLTQAEAAEHLGIAPGAVKTRLHKARASLRARLRPLTREPTMVQMQVTDVRRAGEKHVLMLAGDDHELKIWVGPPEAATIAALLEDVELPRPMTHHLTAALLKAAGTTVREVRVSRLADHTFYGEVVLGDGTAVDARPSDAIALALVEGVPLLVDAAVLEEAAHVDPEWADEHAAADASTEDRRVLADEVRKRVSRP
jgi:RNA polymerase sigma factor (sigma-70 family)